MFENHYRPLIAVKRSQGTSRNRGLVYYSKVAVNVISTSVLKNFNRPCFTHYILHHSTMYSENNNRRIVVNVKYSLWLSTTSEIRLISFTHRWHCTVFVVVTITKNGPICITNKLQVTSYKFPQQLHCVVVLSEKMKNLNIFQQFGKW